VVRVEGGAQGEERKREGAAKGVEKVGAAATIGSSGVGLGWGRGAPIHRIEIKGPNTLSHLSSRP
jgi:hypothetical protein